MGESIKENLRVIQQKMAAACERSGRSISQVRLIGVTKTISPGSIREGVSAGIEILGENYVQEAMKKMELLEDLPIAWHFIGHLQSNKARHAAGSFQLIHTVDRLSLARELNKAGQKLDRKISVLLQVNIGDESTKSGVQPDELSGLHKEVSSMEALLVQGLMALPPYGEDPEEVRPFFRQMKELLDRTRDRSQNPEDFKDLSMGMSHDFEAAIEEGATLVRVGTALFGVRPSKTP